MLGISAAKVHPRIKNSELFTKPFNTFRKVPAYGVRESRQLAFQFCFCWLVVKNYGRQGLGHSVHGPSLLAFGRDRMVPENSVLDISDQIRVFVNCPQNLEFSEMGIPRLRIMTYRTLD